MVKPTNSGENLALPNYFDLVVVALEVVSALAEQHFFAGAFVPLEHSVLALAGQVAVFVSAAKATAAQAQRKITMATTFFIFLIMYIGIAYCAPT